MFRRARLRTVHNSSCYFAQPGFDSLPGSQAQPAGARFTFSIYFRQEFFMKRSIQQGFTLIELMIVVAIIGILAAVALPQYQTYTIKAKVTQLVSSLDNVKTCISETYTSNLTAMAGVNTLCSIAANTLFPSIGPAETGVAAVNGITSAIGAAVSAFMTNNYSAVSANGGNLVWTCQGEPAKYFPPGCRA